MVQENYTRILLKEVLICIIQMYAKCVSEIMLLKIGKTDTNTYCKIVKSYTSLVGHGVLKDCNPLELGICRVM